MRVNGRIFGLGVIAVAIAGCAIGSPGASSIRAAAPAAANYQYTSLYSFTGVPDGSVPGREILVDANGTLYGATRFGGTGQCYNASSSLIGCGTVFTFDIASDEERVLYSFQGPPDATDSFAGLLLVHGEFYGTTLDGGSRNHGAVFEVNASGEERKLHSFRGSSGSKPEAALTLLRGKFYGTTREDGRWNDGMIFEMAPSGRTRILHTFSGASGDGATPYAPLAVLDGRLYGTTTAGGAYGKGTVFETDTSGTTQTVYSFGGTSGDGTDPQGGLTVRDGVLYGTTSFGGAYGYGTVFEMTTSGEEHKLYDFEGGMDGATPACELLFLDGTFYGSTKYGGPANDGTVFAISTSGLERVLYQFQSSPDGINPVGGFLAVHRVLYGLTAIGGSHGEGTIYRIRV
jgi:uncharacterized repeat protein (TIGR03803 family)